MEFEREMQKRLAEHLSRSVNDAITRALSKALGVEDCNPYKYLNRMSSQYRGGIRYVLLDGRDLMCIHPLKTEYHHDEMQCTLHHEYLWSGNKKPTV